MITNLLGKQKNKYEYTYTPPINDKNDIRHWDNQTKIHSFTPPTWQTNFDKTFSEFNVHTLTRDKAIEILNNNAYIYYVLRTDETDSNRVLTHRNAKDSTIINHFKWGTRAGKMSNSDDIHYTKQMRARLKSFPQEYLTYQQKAMNIYDLSDSQKDTFEDNFKGEEDSEVASKFTVYKFNFDDATKLLKGKDDKFLFHNSKTGIIDITYNIKGIIKTQTMDWGKDKDEDFDLNKFIEGMSLTQKFQFIPKEEDYKRIIGMDYVHDLTEPEVASKLTGEKYVYFFRNSSDKLNPNIVMSRIENDLPIIHLTYNTYNNNAKAFNSIIKERKLKLINPVTMDTNVEKKNTVTPDGDDFQSIPKGNTPLTMGANVENKYTVTPDDDDFQNIPEDNTPLTIGTNVEKKYTVRSLTRKKAEETLQLQTNKFLIRSRDDGGHAFSWFNEDEDHKHYRINFIPGDPNPFKTTKYPKQEGETLDAVVDKIIQLLYKNENVKVTEWAPDDLTTTLFTVLQEPQGNPRAPPQAYNLNDPSGKKDFNQKQTHTMVANPLFQPTTRLSKLSGPGDSRV